jgi:hypothetical protein
MNALTKTLGAVSVAALALGALPASAQPQTTFEVRIISATTDHTLQLPDGSAAPAPISPGVYAVAMANPIFTVGGKATAGLQHQAEDGNHDPLLAELQAKARLKVKGWFAPGQAFTITAKPGEKLYFANMFAQSNDIFLAPAEDGIALFDPKGRPLSGPRAMQVALWDAGTEVNQAPGAGSDQAPRQAAPDTGAAENGTVHFVADGFRYPAVASIVRIEIVPVTVPAM